MSEEKKLRDELRASLIAAGEEPSDASCIADMTIFSTNRAMEAMRATIDTLPMSLRAQATLLAWQLLKLRAAKTSEALSERAIALGVTAVAEVRGRL